NFSWTFDWNGEAPVPSQRLISSDQPGGEMGLWTTTLLLTNFSTNPLLASLFIESRHTSMAHPPDGVDAPEGDPYSFLFVVLSEETPPTGGGFRRIDMRTVDHLHNPGIHSDSYTLDYRRSEGDM